MTGHLIAFNDEWVPDHIVEELREKASATRPRIRGSPTERVARRLTTEPRALARRTIR
jgi:hypothetical protein